MMFGFSLTNILIGAAVLAGTVASLYFMHLRVENMTLQRDAAVSRAEAYKETLASYQQAFTDQVQTLNIERQQEIRRQENLLTTLNLIGDMNESENLAVPDTSVHIIGSMYGTAH